MPYLRNFTSHELVIFDDDDNIILKLSSEGQIRVNEFVEIVNKIDGVPIVIRRYDKAQLPKIADGEYLVVSKVVMDAMPECDRLVCPDTSYNSVVKENGKIVGVRRLLKN